MLDDFARVAQIEVSIEDEWSALAPVTDDACVELDAPAWQPTPIRMQFDRESASGLEAARLAGEGSVQLDAERGPVDLGYAVLVDFGAGEAPYDDAPAPIHGEEFRRPGFSDSLVQVALRARIGKSVRLQARGAWARAQDVSILDGLPEARLSWVVVGLVFSW